jgi:hypothetical protein
MEQEAHTRLVENREEGRPSALLSLSRAQFWHKGTSRGGKEIGIVLVGSWGGGGRIGGGGVEGGGVGSGRVGS